MENYEELARAISDLEEERAIGLAEKMLSRGVEPLRVIEVCREGLKLVGERYERREYFLSGLILSGEIFKEIVAMMEERRLFPHAMEEGQRRVILGAPLGDVHDIGKGIVSMLLRCSGFKVIDLGVSVSPSEFVEEAVRHRAEVVGITTLITMAYESIRETVSGFERAGLRDRVRIMLGGGAISQRVCDYAGADAWSHDAMDAVRFARMFTRKE